MMTIDLRAWRKQLGMSQQQAAKAVAVRDFQQPQP